MSLTTKNTDGSQAGRFLPLFLCALVLMATMGISSPAIAQIAQGPEDGCEGDDEFSVLACGAGSSATFLGVAVGPVASASGGTAVGWGADARDHAVAMGDASKALGDHSIAIGGRTAGNVDTTAAGTASIAIGAGAQANNGFSVAIGNEAIAAQDGVAMGTGATAGSSGTAIGANANAGFANSTAIGTGAATTRDNQVALGSSLATYTLGGINSQASKDAQTGTTYMMTTDDAGNLAASTFDLATLEDLPAAVEQHTTEITNLNTAVTQNSSDIADHETRITNNTSTLNLHTTQISGLDNRVTVNENNIELLDGRVTSLETGFDSLGTEIAQNRDEARGGTALALAAANLRYDDRPEKLSIAGGIGHFKGLTGLSFGMGYATSDTFRINGAISGVPELGDVGVSAGVSWTLN